MLKEQRMQYQHGSLIIKLTIRRTKLYMLEIQLILTIFHMEEGNKVKLMNKFTKTLLIIFQTINNRIFRIIRIKN